jgi:aspartate-semialdehyde dehydrogenase
VNIEFHNEITPDEAREILRTSPGVTLWDEPSHNIYPHPKVAEERDEVFVGRIRKDPSIRYGLDLWIVADNLRKGAALNAVQILEELIKE